MLWVFSSGQFPSDRWKRLCARVSLKSVPVWPALRVRGRDPMEKSEPKV